MLEFSSYPIQSDEENYKLCYQYAMSNFKYHRYLSVDSLRVGRSVDRCVEDHLHCTSRLCKKILHSLCTKFKIHSQPERAQALQLLTEKFLDLRLWKSFSKVQCLNVSTIICDFPHAVRYTLWHSSFPAQCVSLTY